MNSQIEYIFQLEMEHRDLVAATLRQGNIIAAQERALRDILLIEHKTNGGDWDEIIEAQRIAENALAVAPGADAEDTP